MQHVKFVHMKDGDKEDYQFLLNHDIDYASRVGLRVLDFLIQLEDSFSAFQVSRLEHSLQTATYAYQDGADIDWIVTALLHDIGDVHAPYNHGDYAATVLAPFVREQCTWIARYHGDFQSYYFPEGVGINTQARDQHQGHPYYDDCVDFCERWDQRSFDPNFKSLSLDIFRPLVIEVFNRPPFDPAIIRVGEREALICKKQARLRHS